METINSNKQEKGKKIIDLPKNIILILAVEAAKRGKSTKAYMESILIEAASNINDGTYEYLKK